MFKLIHRFKTLAKGVLIVFFAGMLVTTHAEMAQTPLLTQSGTVGPNLMFVLDDSGSMGADYFYQYGTSFGAYGMSGPTSTSIAKYSPDVNLMYYDPRIKYKLRLNADGTEQVAATVTSSSPAKFNVYFYRNASGNNVPWPGSADGANSSSYFGTSTNPAFTPAAGLLAAGATTGTAYPNSVPTSGTVVFPKFAARSDCAGAVCTLAEERQNYANWQLYHSTRNKLAQTGIGLAFQPLGATFRLGWSEVESDLKTNSKVGSGVGLYDDTRRSAFFTWLYGAGGSGSTYNRIAVDRVGKYFSREDNKGPWADTPDTASKGISTLAASGTDTADSRKTHASCRRSFVILMTDGYYNDSFTLSSIDTTTSTTVTGTVNGVLRSYQYRGATDNSETRLYRGTTANTMADIAMKYWVTDLRTDLANNVKPIDSTALSRGNPAFWQNMGFYGIGLGVYGTLAQSDAVLNSIASGASTWPAPSTDNPTAIDDMWHAAINGRGKMLSVKNADDLATAIQGMMDEINKITSTQSGVAASTLSLNTGTRKYTPKYTTGSWIGNVVTSNLDPRSGAETSTAWQVVGTDAAGVTYSGIPAHGSRNIVAATGATTWGSFNSSNSYVTSNIVGGTNPDLINYLRGDRTNESPNGTALYRPREELLGDIVNSTPVYIKGALDMSYEKLPSGTYGQASYRAFVATKAARSEGVLFVGANDGMLHGFRDTTGAEVFAFVPRAVLPNLHNLSKKVFDHRYYVDGPNVEADACFGGSSCSTWTNLLVGTAGAGAKTVYALNVTSPMAMSASSVLWEITPASTGFANLGHVLSDVQTGLTKSGDWVAVFGNGYESADGSAHLYVVNLQTGALLKDFTVGATGSNGLGGVRLVRDANQRIIGAYAGDLTGKLWKFDMFSTSSASWIVGLSNSPLYTAPTTQPITAAPALVSHPSGGNVVAFGTGKFYSKVSPNDVANTNTQSLYGVWDSVAFGATTTPSGVVLTSTATLVLQTISAAITGTQVITASNLTTSTTTISYYSVSRNPIDWSTKRGWYINLPNSGQRVIYPIENLMGKIVAVDTMSPASTISDPCVQTSSGKAWNYIIDALTGQGPATPVFDTNGNERVEMTDALVSGYENNADGRTRYIRNVARSSSTVTVFTPLSTQQLPSTTISCSTLGNCAFARHNWRQLFLR